MINTRMMRAFNISLFRVILFRFDYFVAYVGRMRSLFPTIKAQCSQARPPLQKKLKKLFLTLLRRYSLHEASSI